MLAEETRYRGLQVVVWEIEDGNTHPADSWRIAVSFDEVFFLAAALGQPILLPILHSGQQMQLQIENQALPLGEKLLGSISFAIDRLFSSASSDERRFWVSLFDQDQAILYDGDYQSDDSQCPRILLAIQRLDQRASCNMPSAIALSSYHKSGTGTKSMPLLPSNYSSFEVTPESDNNVQTQRLYRTLSFGALPNIEDPPSSSLSPSPNPNSLSGLLTQDIQQVQDPPSLSPTPAPTNAETAEELPCFGSIKKEPSDISPCMDANVLELHDNSKEGDLTNRLLRSLSRQCGNLNLSTPEVISKVLPGSLLPEKTVTSTSPSPQDHGDQSALERRKAELERELARSRESCGQLIQELEQFKTTSMRESELRTQEHILKTSQLTCLPFTIANSDPTATILTEARNDIQSPQNSRYEVLKQQVVELHREYEEYAKQTHADMLALSEKYNKLQQDYAASQAREAVLQSELTRVQPVLCASPRIYMRKASKRQKQGAQEGREVWLRELARLKDELSRTKHVARIQQRKPQTSVTEARAKKTVDQELAVARINVRKHEAHIRTLIEQNTGLLRQIELLQQTLAQHPAFQLDHYTEEETGRKRYKETHRSRETATLIKREIALLTAAITRKPRSQRMQDLARKQQAAQQDLVSIRCANQGKSHLYPSHKEVGASQIQTATQERDAEVKAAGDERGGIHQMAASTAQYSQHRASASNLLIETSYLRTASDLKATAKSTSTDLKSKRKLVQPSSSKCNTSNSQTRQRAKTPIPKEGSMSASSDLLRTQKVRPTTMLTTHMDRPSSRSEVHNPAS